jgi:hypothetical protein
VQAWDFRTLVRAETTAPTSLAAFQNWKTRYPGEVGRTYGGSLANLAFKAPIPLLMAFLSGATNRSRKLS